MRRELSLCEIAVRDRHLSALKVFECSRLFCTLKAIVAEPLPVPFVGYIRCFVIFVGSELRDKKSAIG